MLRVRDNRLFGIQSWVALPRTAEERAPDFTHYPAASLPVAEDGGVRLRLIAGEAWGLRAPVAVSSALFYADAVMTGGSVLALPDGHEERAAYVLEGEIEVSGDTFTSGRMLVFRAGDRLALRAGRQGARVLLLGGAAMDGPRYLFWNFVSSSRERIEQAKADWKEGRFGKVAGDETEFHPAAGGAHAGSGGGGFADKLSDRTRRKLTVATTTTNMTTRIPGRRWIIGVLLGVGILINYFDRINISVAAPQLQKEFGLTPVEMGFLFSAFFWSYSLLQVPGGMVLDRFGVTRVGRWGAFLWSVASAITAISSGFGAIFGSRILLGIAEAPAFPASQKATGYWFPRQERSRSTAIFDLPPSFPM